MESFRFDIQLPDGRREVMVADAARILVGSGAHCDVALPKDQAAPEHVVFEAHAGGVRVRRLAPPFASLDGLPFTEAELRSPATLIVGGTRIVVEHQRAARRDGGAPISAAAMVKGLVLVVLVSAVFVLATYEPAAARGAPATLPSLFGDAPAACPRTDAAEARVLAADLRALAEAARERSPFEPRETMTAVKRYAEASACARVAGEAPLAAELESEASTLRDAATNELRTRRVRLERALAVKDLELAREDVAALRVLCEGQRGDYVSWLAKVERELENNRKNERR